MAGLRERKIAKTKTLVQAHAFELFERHGYDQTTIEQIADAAEISPRTFFRYFHTKEAIVLYDSIDLVVVEAFTKQSPSRPIVQALRNAIKEAYGDLTTQQQQQELQRFQLLGSLPTLQNKLFAQVAFSIDLFAELIADKTQRNAHDLPVRVFAGALVGVLVAVIQQACKRTSIADIQHDFDTALAQFEASWTRAL